MKHQSASYKDAFDTCWASAAKLLSVQPSYSALKMAVDKDNRVKLDSAFLDDPALHNDDIKLWVRVLLNGIQKRLLDLEAAVLLNEHGREEDFSNERAEQRKKSVAQKDEALQCRWDARALEALERPTTPPQHPELECRITACRTPGFSATWAELLEWSEQRWKPAYDRLSCRKLLHTALAQQAQGLNMVAAHAAQTAVTALIGAYTAAQNTAALTSTALLCSSDRTRARRERCQSPSPRCCPCSTCPTRR